jgi:hypothetical protein
LRLLAENGKCGSAMRTVSKTDSQADLTCSAFWTLHTFKAIVGQRVKSPANNSYLVRRSNISENPLNER